MVWKEKGMVTHSLCNARLAECQSQRVALRRVWCEFGLG